MTASLPLFVASLITSPVTVIPESSCLIEISCPTSVFTNYQWSAWVSQDMKTWWEFPQSSPENRRIAFIPGATNTFVMIAGTPIQ